MVMQQWCGGNLRIFHLQLCRAFHRGVAMGTQPVLSPEVRSALLFERCGALEGQARRLGHSFTASALCPKRGVESERVH
ncbi:hypothetical protein AAFF_G00164810 [Aldrovandia affinis]|uniref:Uncharacterized protein n=1 Tax=Aldrovandia affinis TaxID=143900 RepID=A0AAD7WWL2_9TELE|nr:hypothetical protein AAFF_G00164810 [Aldrovandia affinis]